MGTASQLVNRAGLWIVGRGLDTTTTAWYRHHSMSIKPGRNEPCSCGSGKKYKRCCLPTDEAAERARQQALFGNAFPSSADAAADDTGEFFDLDEDMLALDVRAITSVCYTRGFVDRLSDLRAGRNMRVTEWRAPQIPQEILESIEREALDALEGEWGDPKTGGPIQVDVIDLETEDDVVSVGVFNRAIALLGADTEDIHRIHRVCGVLETAAQNSPDQSTELPDAATAVAVILPERTPPIERVDLTAALKEHRRQAGTCALCGEAIGRTARTHGAKCAPAYDAPNGAMQQIVQIRATAPDFPAYWLDVEVKADSTLEALDAFLRRVWLECCGHLSAFRIGTVSYFSHGYDLGFGRDLARMRGQRSAERRMSVKLRDALPPIRERFTYEYDFGSTTGLELYVSGERTGRLGREPARLLARNTAPVWPCAICGQPANIVCTYCLQMDGNAFVCKAHKRQHDCGEREGLMPVVNSPRMGVCAYTG